MKKMTVYIFVICFTFIFCTFKKKEENNLNVSKINLKIGELYGTWANSRLKEVYSSDEIRSFFRPVSGFTFRYDTVLSKYVFEMQYYEQRESLNFDSIIIQNDSIIGSESGKTSLIARFNTKESKIYDFKLIDYLVFATPKDSSLAFSKYTDCILKCSIEEFLLDESLNLFPITVLYDSKKYTINNNKSKCGCYGEIVGFEGYSDYQIIAIYKNGQIELAFNNTSKDQFEFFILEKGTNSILKKISK